MSGQINHSDNLEMMARVEQTGQMAMGNPWLQAFVRSIQATPAERQQIEQGMRLDLEQQSPRNRIAYLFSSLPILSRCPPEAFDLPTNPLKMALEVRTIMLLHTT